LLFRRNIFSHHWMGFHWNVCGRIRFINLFGDFFPVAFAFLRRLPIIGSVLNMPGVKQVTDKIVSGGSLPV